MISMLEWVETLMTNHIQGDKNASLSHDNLDITRWPLTIHRGDSLWWKREQRVCLSQYWLMFSQVRKNTSASYRRKICFSWLNAKFLVLSSSISCELFQHRRKQFRRKLFKLLTSMNWDQFLHRRTNIVNFWWGNNTPQGLIAKSLHAKDAACL